MLRRVGDGVLVHQSSFCWSNAVVVQGGGGVLVVDPEVLGEEMACLARDLSEMGQAVVAGFSTHPHWDHLLWHGALGAPPRYGTAGCAAAVRARLSGPGAGARVAGLIHSDARPERWRGRPDRRLSDGLRLLDEVADDVDVLVPSHGSVGALVRCGRGSSGIGRTCAGCGTPMVRPIRGSARRPVGPLRRGVAARRASEADAAARREERRQHLARRRVRRRPLLLHLAGQAVRV